MSILNQTFGDFEFIIIDDGSTDESLDIIHSFREKDDRIKVFRNEENKGIFFSRNLGLDESTGKYIAVMDSDDISIPTRFEKQVELLENNPEIDVLGTQKISFDERLGEYEPSNYYLSPGLVNWGLIFGYSLCHSSLMFRREIFDEAKYRYQIKPVAQDFDLLVRLSNEHKIANLSEVLLNIRVHENNISLKKRELQRQIAYDIIRTNIINKINEVISDDVISGIIFAKHLKKQKQIPNYIVAKQVSILLIKLMKFSLKGDLTDEESDFIRINTASRLRWIWKRINFNPGLIPFVLYSLILDPKFFIRKLKVFQKTQG